MIFGFHAAEKQFTLRADAIVYRNEIFERLRILKRTVADIVADETDYRTKLRQAENDNDKYLAVQMISAQRLAKSANKNLDDVYKTLFK